MAKTLVIVESPAKARTIRGFLGSAYAVEASVGHIRDLPRSAAEIPKEAKGNAWARLGVNTEADFQPLYIVPDEKKEQVARLKELLKDCSELLLATDEDREGESISWHLREVLKPKVPVKRLVFHEITPEAIKAALAHPRQIDEDVVRAQETRRIVDRLYGYEVSPLLWKKVKPKLSAGRVQSVAVRLIVDRERARIAFKASSWWDVEGQFAGAKGALGATLMEVAGKRIALGRDFDETTGELKARDVLRLDEEKAREIADKLVGRDGTVSKVESRPYRDRPAPPFTTSTLQQEANRKLRWTAKHTMKVAQTLYENGWITYMRTDSVSLSDQAISAARGLIASQYGADHLPKEPRRYKSTAKNAQEAHEAIRPAGESFKPLDQARRDLEHDQARLYELIWKRTVACQMADAEGDLLSIVVDMVSPTSGQIARFSASGKSIRFPGFRRAYVEGSDDPDAELADQERLLPALTVGDIVRAESLTPKGHTTQPPARLTEATLVKELEARGIGRPSTYADIIGKIIERDYVFKRGNALVPTFTAFAVTGLLERHLGELVDYDFTARIEDELDNIALGKAGWVETLRRFYLGTAGLKERLSDAEAKIDPREVCTIPLGRASDVDVAVRIGRYGPFLSAGDRTADVPDDTAPEDATLAWALARLDGKAQGPRVVGVDPAGTTIFLFDGRFGPYLQRGEAKGEEKPPRASLLPGMKVDEIDIETALGLLSLPRTVGMGSTGDEITASNGRFGPYVRRGKETRTVPPSLSVLTITVDEAEALLAQPARRGRATVEPLREIGEDPTSKQPIRVMKGRFGPYVTDGTTNATIPKGAAPENVTLEEAADLLAARRAAGPSTKTKGRRGKAPTLTSKVKRAGSGTFTSGDAPQAAGAGDEGAAPKKAGAKKAGAEKTGAEKTGAEKTATKASGAKATSTKAAPAKATETKAAPAKTTETRPAPAKTAETKAAPAKAAGASKAAPAKAGASKAAPAKAGASKAGKAGAKGKPAHPPPPPMTRFTTVKYPTAQPTPPAPAAPAAPARSSGSGASPARSWPPPERR